MITSLTAAVTIAATALTAPIAPARTVGRLHTDLACPAAPSRGQTVAPGRGKSVALTFDDGPGASTKEVIRILRHAHVTATFFNIGTEEAQDRAMVRTEARDGFALGDHTWDHATLTTLDASGQAYQIDRERTAQARITHHESCLLRPPGGSYDATTVSLAQQRGMTMWLWSVDTEDWMADGSGDQYWIDRIRSRAEAGGTQRHPVILMHNQTIGNPATVAALPDIIRFYQRRGYRFVDLLGNTGRPTITRVSRDESDRAGGRTITLRGDNFRDVTDVHFGREVATRVRVRSAHEIRVVVPPHAVGTVRIKVRTADHGATARGARFRYVRAHRA